MMILTPSWLKWLVIRALCGCIAVVFCAIKARWHKDALLFNATLVINCVWSSSTKSFFKSSVCSPNKFLFCASSSSEEGDKACIKSRYSSETVSKQTFLEGCSSGSCNIERLAVVTGPRSLDGIMAFSLQGTGISLFILIGTWPETVCSMTLAVASVMFECKFYMSPDRLPSLIF